MTINKKEFAAAIAESMKTTKKDAEEFMDSFLDTMTSYLANGDTIKFTGFGSFGTRTRESRNCVNPSTGEVIQVPEKIVAYFKPGKILKDSL